MGPFWRKFRYFACNYLCSYMLWHFDIKQFTSCRTVAQSTNFLFQTEDACSHKGKVQINDFISSSWPLLFSSFSSLARALGFWLWAGWHFINAPLLLWSVTELPYRLIMTDRAGGFMPFRVFLVSCFDLWDTSSLDKSNVPFDIFSTQHSWLCFVSFLRLFTTFSVVSYSLQLKHTHLALTIRTVVVRCSIFLGVSVFSNTRPKR